MNKKLVPILVILVLLAAGGYYFKTKQGPLSQIGDQKMTQTMGEASEFAKAIESGKPTICTMSKDDSYMEYLIKGKSMRMNSTTTIKDGSGKSTTTVGHMINDTKYLYIWDDKTKQGSKMTIPTQEEAEAMAKQAENYQKNAPAPKFESQADYDSLKNDGYSIDCKSGSVEDSVFVPPTDVKFVDPSEMMKAIPSPDANGKYDMSKLQELQKQYGGAPVDY